MTNEKFCFYARFYSEATKIEQMNAMLKFIEDNDIAIKDIFYFEDYAKNSMDERDGLQQVLKLAYEGEFKRIQDDLAIYVVHIIELAGEDDVIDVQR